jgi:hypothetical protein
MKTPQFNHVRIFGGRRFLLKGEGSKQDCKQDSKHYSEQGHDYRIIEGKSPYYPRKKVHYLYISSGIRVSNSDFHQGNFNKHMRRK